MTTVVPNDDGAGARRQALRDEVARWADAYAEAGADADARIVAEGHLDAAVSALATNLLADHPDEGHYPQWVATRLRLKRGALATALD